MTIKCLCGLVGIYEPQVSFFKNTFQSLLVKDVFIQNAILQKSEDIDHLLIAKTEELTNLVKVGNPNDLQAIYDTFIPILISQTSLHLSFQGNFCLYSCFQNIIFYEQLD